MKLIKYFIYIRKSSDDKKGKRQVLSLDAQLREMRKLASQQGLVIVGIIEESQSAKEPGRPKFNKMLARIERGDADGIIIWDIDRLYRNPADEGNVRWMLQRGIIACIKTPTRTFFPEDAGLLMAVEGGRSTDFIIHHKRNVSRGIDEKLLRGEWPGQRPLGYIYDHDLRNIVPHPKHSRIVSTIFEEVSIGTCGYAWVAARLAELGIRTKAGKHWSDSQVHQFLTNRLYTGIMMWRDEAFEGKYKPIVSHELFKKVQTALKERSRPRNVRNGHNFPFCGLFHCTCGSMMSAQWAKGHGGLYRYYRCTRKAANCTEPYVQEKVVVAQCLDILKPLAISTDDANDLRALIDAETRQEGNTAERDAEHIIERLSSVQTKLNKLTRGFLDELIDEESYQAAKADLVIEKTSLKQEKQRLQKTGSSYWNEPVKEVINALELAGKSQTEQSPQEISRLVHKVGTNRLISRKTVSFSFSEPYDFIPSLLAAVNTEPVVSPLPLGGLNPLNTKWCAIQGSNL